MGYYQLLMKIDFKITGFSKIDPSTQNSGFNKERKGDGAILMNILEIRKEIEENCEIVISAATSCLP